MTISPRHQAEPGVQGIKISNEHAGALQGQLNANLLWICSLYAAQTLQASEKERRRSNHVHVYLLCVAFGALQRDHA